MIKELFSRFLRWQEELSFRARCKRNDICYKHGDADMKKSVGPLEYGCPVSVWCGICAKAEQDIRDAKYRALLNQVRNRA